MVKPQTILLVDDHSLITTAMSALLQSMYPDVQIHVGATAKEAVELAEKYGDSADLMILDLGLPDSQGTDLLVRLLQNYPALKILVLSGNCDPDSILKAISLSSRRVRFQPGLPVMCPRHLTPTCLRARSILSSKAASIFPRRFSLSSSRWE